MQTIPTQGPKWPAPPRATNGRPGGLAPLCALALLAALACSSSGTSSPVLPSSAGAPGSGAPVARDAASLSSADCPPVGSATSLTGAGATFPAPLYTRWFDQYASACDVRINYQAVGSGGGINQYANGTVDFGASDGLLTPEQTEKAPAGTLTIPTVAGAVALVYNVQGVKSGEINLSGEAIAQIFLGEITRWNDPRLAVDNPGVSLPNQAIAVVRRSDGSGTTNIFTTYLAKLSPDWQSRVGAGNAVQWPTGVGAEGNAGVAGQVRQLPGALGYVELAYAVQNDMAYANVRNETSKRFIAPSLAATTAAMQGVDLPDDLRTMLVNSSNPEAYPIVGFTWLLVNASQRDQAKAQSLAYALRWILTDGQQLAPQFGYAPLSAEAQAKALKLVEQLAVNGQPVLPQRGG